MRSNSLLCKKLMTSFLSGLIIFSLAGCSEIRQVVYPVEIVEEPEETEPEEEIEEEAEEPTIIISEQNSELPELEEEEEVEVSEDEEGLPVTEDGKIVVDFVIFLGQSNMSGVGGNPEYAPEVPEGWGYEFRAISDPTMLYPIEEPFGKNESFIGGICDFPGSKRGSLVSSFICKYYEETGIPVVAVSASEGATTTEKWMSDAYQADLIMRYTRAIGWLDNNGYKVRKRYAVWLQGESDGANNVSGEEYVQNIGNITRNMFIGGLNKVFIITPGRTLTFRNYFDQIINAQIDLCRTSGYYALGTTVLSKTSTEYMKDEWHYNQIVLDLLGEQTAESVAFYTNNKREMCLYDYKNGETYIPEMFDYTGDEEVEPLDLSNISALLEFRPSNENEN